VAEILTFELWQAFKFGECLEGQMPDTGYMVTADGPYETQQEAESFCQAPQ